MYRPNWWPKAKNGEPRRLLEMCETLHTYYNGSAPELAVEERHLILRCLWEALVKWKTSQCEYDCHVRNLIVAVLDEAS